MNKIDKARKEICAIVAGSSWGDRQNYNLIVNTTDANIKNVATAIAGYAKYYFDRIEQ